MLCIWIISVPCLGCRFKNKYVHFNPSMLFPIESMNNYKLLHKIEG